MLKKRIIGVVVGLALLVATTGVAGVVTDTFGVANPFVGQAAACNNPNGSGGGC